jgi:hypothetical protein
MFVVVLAVESRPVAQAQGQASLPAAPVVAIQPVKRERHGLGLSFGVGMAHAGFGLQARYDVPLLPWWTMSPYVADGLFGWTAVAGGVTSSVGRRHRVVVDVGVAPSYTTRLVLHGTTITERRAYGPMTSFGYEYMSDNGAWQRLTLEYGWPLWNSPPAGLDRAILVGLAFGWRLW